MFTGRLPSEHCTNNGNSRLDGQYTTIAELLRSAGYRTYLYSANPHISRSGGFDQGFDAAEHPWSPRLRDRARRIVRDKIAGEDRSSELGAAMDRGERDERGMSIWNLKATGSLAQEAILDWLDSADDERPFFVFVNYMEAHRPLIPPRACRERVMSPADVARSYAVDRSWTPTWEYTFGLREYDDDEIRLTGATYDAALAELDDLFGKLIGALEAGGHLENTLIILTSDHGEHLGEQHMLDHQYSVYQPVLRVPLIVRYPARFAPGRDRRPVVNFDLFPTLLEVAGIEPPADQRSRATSLLQARQERERFAEDPAAFQVAIATVAAHHPKWDPKPWGRELRALVDGRHKLIWGSDGRGELFDLAADPLERVNLLERQTELAAGLREALETYHRSLRSCVGGSTPPPELSPEQIERLQTLGYVGG
jgi:arylsulfatase A-like enzyme